MKHLTRKKKLDFAFIDESVMLTFQKQLEHIRTGCDSWAEAIVEYCEYYNVDVEEIANLISDGLKAKMYEEGVASGTLKSDTPMLPL